MQRIRSFPTRVLLLCFLATSLLVPLAASAQGANDAPSWQQRFDAWFGETIVSPLSTVLFFAVPITGLSDQGTPDGGTIARTAPLIVVTLMPGGIFLRSATVSSMCVCSRTAFR